MNTNFSSVENLPTVRQGFDTLPHPKWPMYVNVYSTRSFHVQPGIHCVVGQPVASVPVFSDEEKETVLSKFKKQFESPDNDTVYYNIMLGVDIKVLVENTFAQPFPKAV